ncbi:GerMN domain-containing protein [Demequina sediminicola]|uniref:GerMN domain-containing protein n=1 Tax=Demequina sediminicola TaxID=1095026 RepID=UPI000784B8CE|nr:GerMN domain-containing protein [Demequina sediminicola]
MNKRTVAAVAALAAVTLSACASIPTDGDVTEGNGDVAPIENFEPIVQGPAPEDDPAAIITGFLTASAGGVASDFTVAREFLTADASATWDPSAQVTVYDSGAVVPEWDEEVNTVTYEVPLASTLDDSGRLVEAGEGEVSELVFTVVEESGEWRISDLADGVVVSEANFVSFFRPVSLAFATPDLSTVVGELRWLPNNYAATAAARELIEGPSPWLADAVVTGFPATAALAVESVVVADGVATVDLTAQSAGTQVERSLADEQLRLTLSSLPDVTEVDVRIGGLPISDEDTVALESPAIPDKYAVVAVDGRLGMWDGTEVRVTPADVGALPAGASVVARDLDASQAAWVAPDGVYVTAVLADGWESLVPLDEADAPATEIEATRVVAGTDAVDPSFDDHGYLWTAVKSGGAITVTRGDDAPIRLGENWLAGREVSAISVSRSGTMVAVQSRSGGQPILEVAAVVRDASGVPIALGEAKAVGADVGTGVDIAWIDEVSFALLGEPVEGTASPLWTVTVGGETTAITTMREATGVAARSGQATLLVVGDDEVVEERSGTSWTMVLEGITDIAYAG